MPTQCVPDNRCGAVFSGWLKGGHPTLADGEVSSMVCFTRGGDCCKKASKIHVKDCGSYFIYQLQQVPACDLRYCSTDWMLQASHSAKWKDSQIDLLKHIYNVQPRQYPLFMVSVKQWVVYTQEYHWTAWFDLPSKSTPITMWLKVVSSSDWRFHNVSGNHHQSLPNNCCFSEY